MSPQELCDAFEEYIASSSNSGAGVAPSDDDVERAQAALDRFRAEHGIPVGIYGQIPG